MFVQRLPQVKETLEKLIETSVTDGNPMDGYLKELGNLIGEKKFGKYKAMVEHVLDLERAPREFLVRPDHDDSGELQSLATERKNLELEVKRVQERLENGVLSGMDPKWENDPKMVGTHGFHFRINKKHDAELSKIKNGNHLIVVVQCIRWNTKELETLSNRYSATTAEFLKKQGKTFV